MRNLSRMTSEGAGASEDTKLVTTRAAVDDIDDEELNLIVDRTRLFTAIEEEVTADNEDDEVVKENCAENGGNKRSPSKSAKSKSPKKVNTNRTTTRMRYVCTGDIPREGKMYDILDDTSSSSLQTVGY